MNKARQLKLLMDCAHLLAAHKTCNEPSFMAWWGIVKFAHFHGYLYTGFDDGEIDVVVIAYRVPFVEEKTGDVMPKKEAGNSLYVSAVASRTQDILKLRRLMNWYLKRNKSVNKIVYHRRNSDDLVIHNIRRKKWARKTNQISRHRPHSNRIHS